MKVHTNLRVDEELLKTLKAAAKKQRRSFTNYVEVVLWDHVNVIKEVDALQGERKLIKKLVGK